MFYQGWGNLFVELCLAMGMSFFCAFFFSKKKSETILPFGRRVLPFLIAFLLGGVVEVITPYLGGE